jgi:predicted nucleotidyltransferase
VVTGFSAAQADALRGLARIWPNREFTLIGALALRASLAGYQRQTNDVDVTLILPPDVARQRLASSPGWTPVVQTDHEWRSPAGTRVHVLPIPADALRAGELIWPQSGRRMNLAGMRHAFSQRVVCDIGSGTTITVATVPCVTLLKAVAFLDRPRERERDLGDLAEVLEGYIGDESDRRWTRETEGVAHEDVSAFLLGLDTGGFADAAERDLLFQLLGVIREERDGGYAQAAMLRLAPPALRGRPEVLLRRLGAFERGLQAV